MKRYLLVVEAPDDAFEDEVVSCLRGGLRLLEEDGIQVKVAVDVSEASNCAETIDGLIDGEQDEWEDMLGPARDLLRSIADA